MQYLYGFANVSLIIRVIDRLSRLGGFPLKALTVIYLVDRWVMRLHVSEPLNAIAEGNLVAFLQENGIPHKPSVSLLRAFDDLDLGTSLTQVMNEHQVVVVSHGAPDPVELYEFRSRFVEGLGYCPPTLV
ncbi:MAG: hypothetical protein AAGI45_04440 [Cyanobacteria bacterium P01_H01_bin.26]